MGVSSKSQSVQKEEWRPRGKEDTVAMVSCIILKCIYIVVSVIIVQLFFWFIEHVSVRVQRRLRFIQGSLKEAHVEQAP